MEEKHSPFYILQISEEATNDEIRERYLFMSKTFHPDKQPLQNWNLTKKYFEKVDKAYKSISTGLRKYIYFRFGIQGIDLIEKFPDDFSHLEGKQNTQEGRHEIDEIIFHVFFSDARDHLDDQGKVDAMTVIDISPFFQVFAQGIPRMTYPFPIISKIQTTYSFAGPSLFGFQNNFYFQFLSKTNQKSFGSAILSTKRIFTNVLLKNYFGYRPEGFYNSLTFQYLHSPTLVGRVNALSYSALQGFQIPKFEIQKRFDNGVVFTTQSNFKNTAFQMYVPGKTNKHVNKNFVLNYGRRNIDIGISFDYQLSSFCRLQVQLNSSLSGNTTSLGCSYGLILHVSDQTKISIISRFSQQNFLDLKINYKKYNLRLPIVCTTLTHEDFQTLKILSMVIFYFAVKYYTSYKQNKSSRKDRLKIKSFARLNQEQAKFKSSLIKIQQQQAQKAMFQTSSNGLLILTSYVGTQSHIRKISKRVQKNQINISANPLSQIRKKLSYQYQQVVNVTKKVQMLVYGSRIQNQVLKIYNPIYDQTQQPYLLIYYSLRGQIHCLIQPVSKQIKIGLQKQKPNNLITNGLNWLRKVHLLF